MFDWIFLWKGDRIWFFALSIYFIEINKDTLQINAINGFTCSIAIIILGAIIGSFVDTYQRLTGNLLSFFFRRKYSRTFWTVIRVSLVLQNLSIVVTSVIVICVIILRDEILTVWNGDFIYFLQGSTIITLLFNSDLLQVCWLNLNSRSNDTFQCDKHTG